MSINSYPIYVVTAATTSTDYPTSPGYIIWPGGSGTVQVDGTYDGATVTIKTANPNSSNYVALSGATFDVSNVSPGTITLGKDMRVRFTVSGVGASTSLRIAVFPTQV